jgi:hypothetical protein
MPWRALVLAVVLAGCLDDPADGDLAGPLDARQARPDEADPIAGHFEQTFSLVVDPQPPTGAVAVEGVTDRNCIRFWDPPERETYVLTNGTATLSWSAVTPLADDLSLRLDGSDPAVPPVQGRSPLTLAFDDVSATFWGVGFSADHGLDALPVEQPATLTLAFDHVGELPSPSHGACRYL